MYGNTAKDVRQVTILKNIYKISLESWDGDMKRLAGDKYWNKLDGVALLVTFLNEYTVSWPVDPHLLLLCSTVKPHL